MSAGRASRVCIYRPQQCGQVVAYQHAHKQQEPCQDQREAGKDPTHQPIFDKQRVVSGGPAGLWLCPNLERVARQVAEDDYRLPVEPRDADERVCACGLAHTTPTDRHRLYQLPGLKRHTANHCLHQDRQAETARHRRKRESAQTHPAGELGGAAHDDHDIIGEPPRARAAAEAHRRNQQTTEIHQSPR